MRKRGGNPTAGSSAGSPKTPNLRDSNGRRNKPNSGPQFVVLESCIDKLNKGIMTDEKTLQKYLIMLGIGDPTIIRSTGNLPELLGSYVTELMPCVAALSVLIKSSPEILKDEMKQNSEYGMYLFGALAERITLYDYIQRHPESNIHERNSIDHRFWTHLTQRDRYGMMIEFYCRITRLYLEKNPLAFQNCLRPHMEFLMKQLQVAEEILSEELVATARLMVSKTDCLGFFIGLFMNNTQRLVLSSASDDEVYLESDFVSNANVQYYTNIANIMSYLLVTPYRNPAVRDSLISEKILSMQFFPILLAAVFRAQSCKGYLPLFYKLLDTQSKYFKGSHLHAISAQVDRIAKIIRHATLQSQTKQCFGIVRYNALRLLIPLIRFEQPTLNLQFCSQSILPLLFVLMFDTYPHSSLIHNVIVEIFSEILDRTRRNKNQSIFASLVTGAEQEQLLSILNTLADHMADREFGVPKDVSYLEPARIIFMLFDDCSRIKDIMKSQPALAAKWRAISKANKAYSAGIEKSKSKTQKIISQAKKMQVKSVDSENEFSVLSKLKTMENADSDDITDLSFLTLKHTFRTLSAP